MDTYQDAERRAIELKKYSPAKMIEQIIGADEKQKPIRNNLRREQREIAAKLLAERKALLK